MDKSAPTLRARVRAEMTAEIKRIALDHLAADGSALSLRAVARDMGMVSSALYRYFPSRDDLLTALIIDAYDALGLAAEEADAAFAERADPVGRWLAVGHAIRAWAVARPHEYALIYGSPIPGYSAPQDTITPANRPVVVLAGIVADARAAGGWDEDADIGEASAELVTNLTLVADFLATGTSHPTTARFLTAMTQLFGAINFELFGRLNNVISDLEGWYDWQLRSMAEYLGLGRGR
jgi:AcrR family transcriptional regulator